MVRLLLIEDDPAIVDALALSLGRLDHAVEHLTAATDDLEERVGAVDAVILDVGLPGEDGFAVCRRIRRSSAVPILMLTARSDDIDTVAGLEAGADDYVVKPVSPRVLDARIKAALRRSARPPRGGGAAGAARRRSAGDRPGRRRGPARRCAAAAHAHGEAPDVRLRRSPGPGAQPRAAARDGVEPGLPRRLPPRRQRDPAAAPKIDPPEGASHIETVRGFGYRFRPTS